MINEISQPEEEHQRALSQHELTILHRYFPPLFDQLQMYLDALVAIRTAQHPDENAHPQFREVMKLRIDEPNLAVLRRGNNPLTDYENVSFKEIEELLKDPEVLVRKLVKTGSELHFLIGGSLTGIIIHVLDSPEAVALWEALAEGRIVSSQVEGRVIPVAPILEQKRSTGLRVRHLNTSASEIVSRYCGPTISSVKQQLQSLSDEMNLPRGTSLLASRVDTLINLLEGQVFDITHDLNSSHIQHGHPHMFNFTVEFYPTDIYEAQLAMGKTVNTVPACDPITQEQIVEFNVATYLEDPDRYTPIVRIIDFDQARQTAHWDQVSPFMIEAFNRDWSGSEDAKGIVLNNILVMVSRFIVSAQYKRTTKGPTQLVAWALGKIGEEPAESLLNLAQPSLELANQIMSIVGNGDVENKRFMDLAKKFHITSLTFKGSMLFEDDDFSY